MTDRFSYGGIWFPKAYVVDSKPSPTREWPSKVTLYVRCPLCLEIHHHGGDAYERGNLGHKTANCRAAHDGDGSSVRGYFVFDERA